MISIGIGLKGGFPKRLECLLVKGLEFQDVIVLEADEENYKEKLDINYLYVACSRAISTLTVLYVGKITKYLKNEMGKRYD